jgi:DNA-binding LytR/AlgR family response regulator
MDCIIIEDQPPAQRILKRYIEDIGTLELKGTFSDALLAMEFLKSVPIDLIFLDIHLPKISGIDFLKTIPNPPKIILTTAFSDYALEGYELDVVDYLLKPFSFQRFVKAVSKVSLKNRPEKPVASNMQSQPIDQEIFIKSGYEHIRIDINDIIYIKSDADYTEIYLQEKKHLSSEALRFWEEKLDTHQFIRVHKSYIINASKIKKIMGNQVYLTEKTIIPVGRAYKDSFRKRFIDT